MSDDEILNRARKIIVRVVREKLPSGGTRRVAAEFAAWIDTLPEKEFDDYLKRLKTLAPASQTEHPTGTTGTVIMAASSILEDERAESFVRKMGGEATAYYALALWRTIQVEVAQADGPSAEQTS